MMCIHVTGELCESCHLYIWLVFCRPRPAAGLVHASTYAGSIAQPVTINGTSGNVESNKQQSITSHQNIANNNIGTGFSNGGSGPSVISQPLSSNPQNPFDTAWALRNNTSTNPFLPSSTAAASSSSGPGQTLNSHTTSGSNQQFSKEFEISM